MSLSGIIHHSHSIIYLGSKEGTVVRALASQQCAQPGSISGLGIILCGLSLLLVLVLAPGGFSLGTLVSPLLKN